MNADPMLHESSHPSDQELLLASDGEHSRWRASRVRAHLAACWICRTRYREIEGTIGDFIHAHHQNVNPAIPPEAGARARLKAQLSELASAPDRKSWSRLIHSKFDGRPAFAWAALLFIVLGIALITDRFVNFRESALDRFRVGPTPKAALTPGATIAVSRDEICAPAYKGSARIIPAAVRQKVFRNYGIPNADPSAYEVDYLITPELGGSDDIRNLWPEPYSATVWNAYVKDALENRLHQLVCQGDLDLATAQRDLSSNWIASYKKYFPAQGRFPE